MATKYTILETTVTEESTPFTRKEYAVKAADALAEEHPGIEFAVATSSGKVVHKAMTEAPDPVDPDPVDDVPSVQVDADLDDTATDDFSQALTEVLSEDNPPAADEGDAAPEGEGHGLPVVDADAVAQALAQAAPATPVAATQPVPVGAELELCAANTNAKRMHYRTIGQTRTACGSANTSRRANAHQIETASLCPNCEKLAKGRTVDTRPAGAARGTGSRRKPKQLIMDAGEIRDLVAHLKQGLPYSMELTDGTRVDVVGGDPQSKELDEPDSDKLSDVRSINIVSA